VALYKLQNGCHCNVLHETKTSLIPVGVATSKVVRISGNNREEVSKVHSSISHFSFPALTSDHACE